MTCWLACLAWVHFACTLPRFMAVPEDSAHHCETSIVPEVWLSGVRFYGQYQGGPGELLREFPGQAPGSAWEGFVEIDTSRAVLVWVTVIDSVGNRSCWSNRVLLRPELVTGVPRAGPADTLWFDVAGRRIERRPRRPGVYFWQLPGRLGKRVDIR